jgi:hypothetical protein
MRWNQCRGLQAFGVQSIYVTGLPDFNSGETIIQFGAVTAFTALSESLPALGISVLKV